MTIDRSPDLILVALYLSRCGQKRPAADPLPPKDLGTDSWRTAYAMFFDRLSAGRTLRSFHNSLKASRDQFDGHVDSGRRGWREGDQPKPLIERDASILKKWRDRPDEELWNAVAPFVDFEVASISRGVLRDLEAEPDEGEETVAYGLEGKGRAVISRRRERSPRLRAAALNVHGYACQVCGFDFERAYGEWGRSFAEVHHIAQLAQAPEDGVQTDPVTDLAVVCSNCHRMIHRKPKHALSLQDLKSMLRRE